MATWITGGTVLTPGGGVEDGHVKIEGGTIAAVGTGSGEPAESDVTIDATGLYVAPGFVDTHIHGLGGFDAMDGPDGVEGMSLELVKRGVTAFLPTLVSAPPDELARLVTELSPVVTTGADMAGLHLEGPYLDPGAPGMFAPEDFRPFDVDELESLARAGDGAIRVMTIACHGDAADSLPRINMTGIVPSLGHAAGTYADAKAAIDKGLSRCTHGFNAMTGMHHREPGIAGAMLLHRQVTAELILDGEHVHPAMARMLFEMKGAARLALVSDSMPFAGLGEGSFEWRGYEITVADGAARISAGNLAGSVLTLDQAVRNAVEMLKIQPVTARNAATVLIDRPQSAPRSMSLAERMAARETARVARVETAVEMASLTPANSAGLGDTHGSLEPRKRADIVLLDADLFPVRTLVGGETVWEARG